MPMYRTETTAPFHSILIVSPSTIRTNRAGTRWPGVGYAAEWAGADGLAGAGVVAADRCAPEGPDVCCDFVAFPPALAQLISARLRTPMDSMVGRLGQLGSLEMVPPRVFRCGLPAFY